LKGHKITGVYRAKMVDWMIEVLSAFKSSNQTFFLSVQIMDRYFDALTKLSESKDKDINHYGLELNELHLIGIVSMFIASKYEDVYPLLMKTVVRKIAHGKVTDE